MTPPPTLYHALLRPCILQTLRATGYHATRPATLDTLTELAVRYFLALCRATAQHAIDNNSHWAPDLDASPPITVVDVRMALEEVGAIGVVERFVEPEEQQQQQQQQQDQSQLQGQGASSSEVNGNGSGDEQFRYRGTDDDTRGVEEFAAWFSGAKCRAIKDMVNAGLGDGVGTGSALVEGETISGDYLNALMSKHSKSAEDSKFHGTILGKGNDSLAEVFVEGGEMSSINKWADMMHGPSGNASRAETPTSPVSTAADSRPVSSGLSSVGDRLGDERDTMDLT